MNKKLYALFRQSCILLMILISSSAMAQTWDFRNGFGSATPGQDRGLAMATDAAGNVYITGSYVGQINFGQGLLPSATANEVYVAKFSPAGACIWSVAFTGTGGNDVGTSIVTDGTSVFVGGTYNGTLTVPPLAAVTGTGLEGFVAKLNANTGAGIWVTDFGGGSVDNVHSLCLDGSGNIYLSGNFFVSSTFGPFTRNANGGTSSDLYVAKLDALGTFTWVSSGGSLNSTDNALGSGVTYVAASDEVIVTGSYNGATATYGSVVLNNAGGNDICLLEVNAADGTFISGAGVGGTASEEGLGIVYDAYTQNVALTGYFASASITFPGNTAINNASAGSNDLFYAMYNPADNTFTWSNGAGGSAGADRGNGIASDGGGGLLIVGNFKGTLSLPTSLLTPVSITNTRTNGDDIFLARINAANGNGQLLGHGAGDNSTTTSSVGAALAVAPGNKVWITGSFATNITFAPLTALAPPGGSTADVILARYNNPPPFTATQSQTPVTCNVGCNGTATVTPSGGVTPYTYVWTGSASTTGTASGLCPGATLSVTVTDAIGNTVTKNYTITPSSALASANTTNTTFVVSATNNNIYDASCNLIATLLPTPGSPVSGTVAARVWFEPSVPVYPAVTGKPYVQRHYELMPAAGAATATAKVTLYFTQLEFNNFNAAPGSTANLPTGPADAPGKANVRLSKFSGASNNPATGLPGTYTGTAALIDPADADIVWNAALSRWEISFNTVGFSGFFLQTSTAILPVTWLSVNGSLNLQGKANITWKVQEQQVASYTIEKSLDGQPFVFVADIISKGNGENEYNFQEAQALAGKATYRIKQTDINGRTTYSKSLLLRSDNKGWVTLYPNPVKRTAILNVTDKELLNTTAHLYDGTGREIQRIQITQSVTTIHMEQFNAGVYTLKLKNGQMIRILKE